ncbi:MAG: MaoC family dehydratase [Rhizobiales bacterium]|nr:MaoC family dehydratase [Hyphomicrobiales bacterium]
MSVAGTWQWFDEFETGQKAVLGSYTFDAANVTDFAGRFDPQPFHLDADAAAKTHFGALCASGWHTAAAYMKCCAAHNFAGCDTAKANGRDLPPLGPSPGFENLKWLKPVYAGDTVTFHTEVTGKREMASRDDWGLVFAANTGINQNGDLVFSFDGKLLVARR